MAFVWLGLSQGSDGLQAAVFLLLLSWTSDATDGPLARRSHQHPSWLGKHDLEVDMIVSLGLLSYMMAAGFIITWAGAAYALIAFILFWLSGYSRSIGMLMQAPVYGWFIWTAYRDGGWVGWLPLIWIATAVLLTWPRFPNQVIPEFITGIQKLIKKA